MTKSELKKIIVEELKKVLREETLAFRKGWSKLTPQQQQAAQSLYDKGGLSPEAAIQQAGGQPAARAQGQLQSDVAYGLSTTTGKTSAVNTDFSARYAKNAAQVKQIQALLAKAGAKQVVNGKEVPLVADGKFGSATTAAFMKAFPQVKLDNVGALDPSHFELAINNMKTNPATFLARFTGQTPAQPVQQAKTTQQPAEPAPNPLQGPGGRVEPRVNFKPGYGMSPEEEAVYNMTPEQRRQASQEKRKKEAEVYKATQSGLAGNKQ